MELSKKYFDFDKVRIIPRKGILTSRDEADTTTKLGPFTFKNPVILANMVSCINEDLSIKLAKENYCYIYHRFNHNNIDYIKRMNERGFFTSISIGVKEDAFKQLKTIKEDKLKVDIICVDIAHGHSILMQEILRYAKYLGIESYIIGGNVCTEDAVSDLTTWGCDAIKIGIGPGSACTTFKSTHVGTKGWQASCVYNLSKTAKVPLILDGGITDLGSISASCVLGATMVMVGGLLSGFIDSPGDLVTSENGKVSKEFFGSASEFNRTLNNEKVKYTEGTKYLIDLKPQNLLSYMDKNVNEAIRSAISYVGGKTVNDLSTANFIVLE
jgi:GMP reductase